MRGRAHEKTESAIDAVRAVILDAETTSEDIIQLEGVIQLLRQIQSNYLPPMAFTRDDHP